VQGVGHLLKLVRSQVEQLQFLGGDVKEMVISLLHISWPRLEVAVQVFFPLLFVLELILIYKVMSSVAISNPGCCLRMSVQVVDAESGAGFVLMGNSRGPTIVDFHEFLGLVDMV